MKYSFFLDTSTSFFCFAIFNNKEIIETVFEDNTNKHVDNAVEKVFQILNKNNISLSMIDNIYVTNGPGKKIGVLTTLLIAQSFIIANENIQIWFTNTLDLQISFNSNKTSIIHISKNNYYIKHKTNIIFNPKNKIKADAEDYSDFHKILNNIIKLSKFFKLAEKGEILVWKI